MKRSVFLGSAGAAVLAGCGGHAASSLLPSPARGAGQGVGSTAALRMVPAVADPIPAGVLAQPILGEAWRFDGAAVPSGWLRFDGQTLLKSRYAALFAQLGDAPGAKSASGSFSLPKCPFGVIIASTGMQPASPEALRRTGRDFSIRASLGPGANAAPPRIAKPENPELLKARDLAASAPQVRDAAPQPIDTARVAAAMQTAREQISFALSPSLRASLSAIVGRVVDGEIGVRAGIDAFAGNLSQSEAAGILAAYDRMQQQFNGGRAVRHADVRFEAASAAVSTAITQEQAAQMAERNQAA